MSTVGQETDGESLRNQERTFAHYLERTGHQRIAAYHEAASAGTVEGRLQFTRMLRELAHTKPDCIIVETLDRFTRNLREGLNLLEELRGHGVGLLPLDWNRATPLNIDDDRDWADVVEEFTSAEKERRRIRRRVRRAYLGREERGATFTNRIAFGLRRVGDHLQPDPQTIWLVHEAEERVLRGESLHDVTRWAHEVNPKAWRTHTGLRRALSNERYVLAGARSPQVHAALAAVMAAEATRFGQQRRHDHEFTGVFVCGHCLDAGHAVTDSLMSGTSQPERIICARWKPGGVMQYRHGFSVNQERIRPYWDHAIAHIHEPAWLEQWSGQESGDATGRTRALHAQLADIDQAEAATKRRRDAAFDILAESDAKLKAQARKMLEEIEQDEAALRVRRVSVLGELASRPPAHDLALIRSAMAAYGDLYAQVDVATKNRLNRALCEALGSHPVIRRVEPKRRKWSELDIVWEGVLTERSPAS